MVFDDDQNTRGVGESPPGNESRRADRQRGSGAGTAAAAAGAAGAGLGAGAAAGIVGGDDAVDFLRGRLGQEVAADQPDLSEVESRVEAARAAAEEAARNASIDVFDGAAGGAEGQASQADLAAAASLIGGALPPSPTTGGGEQPQQEGEAPESPTIEGTPPPAQPDGSTPAGDGPPTSPPSIGRPRPEPAEGEIEGEAPAGPEGSDGPEAPEAPESAPAPAGPGAPDLDVEADEAAPPPSAPGAPSPPSFPTPPSAGAPPAPAPSTSGGTDDDEVVSEAPAPPAGPGPSPAPGTSDSEEIVAESPVAESPAPPATGAPVIPDSSDDDDIPVSGQPSGGAGSSDSPSDSTPGGSAPPVSSSPGASDDPDSSAPPPASSGDSSEASPPGTSAPSTPDESGSPSAPEQSGGSDSSSSGSSEPAPAPSGPGTGSSSDDSSSSSSGYPYVHQWGEDGNWVEVAMQNDYGQVYYLRYHEDGGVYHQNEYGQWEQIQGENLPQLLYVDEYGTAYFTKVQYQHNVYFSLDTDGDLDWVDYDDVPGYEPPEYDDGYDYPRVIDYYGGEDGWALVQLEDGSLVKYYDEGGAYWVDEYGNETPYEGYQVPTLLHIDSDGDAYFRVFNEAGGYYQYYTIDHDGGVEYIHDYDVPGYEEPPVNGVYEYPRTIEWDADEGWVMVQNENGDYARFYVDGNAYPVDEHGVPLEQGGAYNYATLLYVDEDGNAYFQSGEEGNYEYYMIDYDGGVEYVSYEDIPVYEDVEYDDYPRLVEYYDGEPDWALLEYEDGRMVKYYGDEGGEYEVYPDGGEMAVMTPHHLISVDQYGNAYFYIYDPDGHYQYYSVDGEGGIEYIDPHTIPGYDVPEEYEPYDYPRVVEWDYDAGWVMLQTEEGHYARYYLDGEEVPLDENGNPITNGLLPFDGDLLYFDQDGNAYFRGGEEGDYYYFRVDYDGGVEYVDYDDVPIHTNGEAGEYDYPRIAEWNYDEGWVIVHDDGDYYIKYFDDGTYYYVDEEGNQLPPNGAVVDARELLYVDPNGNAYFRTGDEGNYNYYILDEQGHMEYIQYEDVPGYGEGLEEGEYEYPRAVQWDAGDGWVILEIEGGQYVKYYEDRPAHFVDEYGNELTGVGAPGSEHLVQIDQYGNAYFQVSGTDGYEYYRIGHGGGLETVDPATIPDYDYQADEDPDPQVRVVQWDADAGWVIMEDQQGYPIKFYENGDAYFVDQYGNETLAEGYQYPMLVQVDGAGNAYFRSGEEPDYAYQVYYVDGGYASIAYEDIPDYEGAEDDYEYPRTTEWDDDAGWVIVEDQNGAYIKFYEDRPPHYVDADGNAIPGEYPTNARLVQIDEYGNAYFQVMGVDDYDYFKIDHDGGTEPVAPEDVPDYEHEPYNADYEYPRVVEWDADAGWALLETDLGYNVKLYEDGQAYFVDEYGNETPAGDYPLPVLLQVDAQGNAYLRDGEAPDYYYYKVDYDGGYEPIAVEDIPNYEEPEEEYEVDGYLPDGAPEYFGDPMWVNPETDPRFVLYEAREMPDGEYVRTYAADFDGNGTADYAIQVTEYPDGRLELQYHNAEGEPPYHTIEIDHYPNGAYQQYRVTVEGDAGYGVPEYDEADGEALANAEQAAYDLLPDGLPDEIADGYPNPEAHPDYYFSHAIPGAGGIHGQSTYMFYSGDGTQTVAVVSDGSGGGVVYWFEGYVESPWAVSPADIENAAMMTFDENGQYAVTYWDPAEQNWVETPPVEEVYEYEVDGYLPDGAPEYFGDPMWVNPELDERFELYEANEYADYTSRIYRADLDGDGNHDYQIIVNERPDGTIEVQYYEDYQSPASAMIYVNQDANGYYQDYAWDYGQDTQGVPAYYAVDDGQGADAGGYDAQYVYGLLHDDLPARFYGSYMNPEHDPAYAYHHSEPYGDAVYHVFDGGGMSVVVQEHADGTQTLYWHDEAPEALEPPYSDGAEARAYVYGDGQYSMEYWYDGQWVEQPPQEGTLGDDYEVDGYFPGGAGAYFLDERWPNPEEDDRFEMTNESSTADGGYARVYNADLTGDGVWDYQVTVIEYPNGRYQVEYYGADGMEARIYVDQYGEVEHHEYYVENPLGVGAYEGQEQDVVYEADGYLPQGAPDYFEFGGEQWDNPEAHGYELFNQNDGLYEYRHPDTGEYVSINVLDDGSYYVNYRGDEQPGAWEINFHVYENGTYEAFDGTYYDDYQADQQPVEDMADAPVEDDYLPDWLPYSFEHDGITWPSPTQEGFEHMFNNQGNAYFTNGDYTMLVYDNGDGSAIIYIDDLSNGGSWDTGFRVYSDGNYEFLEGDELITGTQASDTEQIEELDEEGAAQIAAVHSEQEAEEGEAVDPEAGLIAPEYVFYGLPAYFEYDGMSYPSPAQGDWEYEGVYSVYGVNVHQFSQGNYTVMIQDSAGGDRVIYVNDHTTGSNVDAGYILRADGTLEIHPDWAPVETQAAPDDTQDEEAETVEAEAEAAASEEEPVEDETEGEEDLQFLTEEEEAAQQAEEEGEEPLEFNGPETGEEEEPEAPAEPEASEETVEPVEIAQPDLVETEAEAEPISTSSGDEDMAADDDFDDDDDGSGL